MEAVAAWNWVRRYSLALLLMGGLVGCGSLKQQPQPDRYVLLSAGAYVVKLNTTTGHAWRMQKVRWTYRWEPIAEESTIIWYRDPKTGQLKESNKEPQR